MASFEQSTKSNATFRVVLARKGPWYYGEPITGEVMISVKDLFYLRGLVLVLRGMRSCSISQQYVPSSLGVFWSSIVD